MNRKDLKQFIQATLIAASVTITLPAFAFGKKEPIIIPENYPAKYNAEYVERIKPLYKDVSEDHIFHVALDMLKDTNGEFSRRAILGNNLSQKPVRVMFKDLSQIKPEYADFDALGWKKG